MSERASERASEPASECIFTGSGAKAEDGTLNKVLIKLLFFSRPTQKHGKSY